MKTLARWGKLSSQEGILVAVTHRFKSCQPDRCLALSEAHWGLPRAPRGTYVEQGTNLTVLRVRIGEPLVAPEFRYTIASW